MSVARRRIHQGHERLSDGPQERFIDDPKGRRDFKCLAAHSQYSLPVEALNVIVELSKSLPVEVNTGSSTIELHLAVNSQNSLPVEALNLIDQALFHGDHFVFSVHSAAILGKNASIGSKLPAAVCWSQEKGEEGVKSTCFMSKATSVPQSNHSQYSSPVEALNLIVESNSRLNCRKPRDFLTARPWAERGSRFTRTFYPRGHEPSAVLGLHAIFNVYSPNVVEP